MLIRNLTLCKFNIFIKILLFDGMNKTATSTNLYCFPNALVRLLVHLLYHFLILSFRRKFLDQIYEITF